jgi:hypothetical protein
MVNLTYPKNRQLPTDEEMPSSDETPVDNQLQNDIPNLLLNLLAAIRISDIFKSKSVRIAITQRCDLNS